MNYRLGSSVPAFSDAIGIADEGTVDPSFAHPHELPEGEAGTATLYVDGDGVVCACSRGAASMLGRESEQLVGDAIWRFLPALEGRRLLRESRVDPHLAFLCHCGLSFRVLHPGGADSSCRMFIHTVSHEGRLAARLILRNNVHQPSLCL